ncbi:TPA: hypothetical protein SCR74_003405 [Citrobacter freundii]|uniref:hypothetical protein n=1 Tax=Citrobacter freundii TaxID=546 RepID=UPI001BCA6BD4|nr:hypothetical protein [Citrobacter freundii]HBU6168910.1 hypothetical protein [Citrobacter freundii]HBV8021136.1 hypothetical protein [Citrobacter freundii]HEG1872476.1 hypothetical protein [Citrobacter freundii]
MSKIPNTRIIFVEGDTEVSLFNNLKKNGTIQAKKIVKKNLWNECIKKYSVVIPKNCDIIVVFDIDVITQVDRFIQNIKFLKSRKHTIILMQQTNNFEEEIAHCCSLTPKKLFAKFCKTKSPNADDFKRDFIACTNQLDKLTTIGWDKDKWFVRILHPCINSLHPYQSTYNNYF